ncbi:HAD family hydrolase [Halosolutus amylolyticus]|uniref:HAD family hydrolase n=1 Tax=Halosolutus amylolyticus TaxID=2932267 RepID=A0ABD5PXE7_9EURY|nr:HAD family hydrolase [Halosolutus amylolyticus]
MTTAVYFDLDGTLCSYAVPFEEQFESTVAPYGEPSEAAYDAYVDRLLDALDSCESEPYRRAFEAVTDRIPLDVTPETLAREYCEVEREASVVSADTRRVLDRVAKTAPIGILTNGDDRQQRSKLEHHGLAEAVDEVIVSNGVDVRKPDRRIFDLAKARLPADDYVYVGDSYEEDVLGARQAGFRTVYVTANDEPADVEAADAVVSSVGDLLEPESLPASIRPTFRTTS